MPTFNVVNYSLRPSKSIQRQLVFQGLHSLQTRLALSDMVYIGFGSIWFTDFVLAHKTLDINDMVSIEKDDIGYARAQFNAPYATVRIRHGSSTDILPTLYIDDSVRHRPWVVWLDYDRSFDEDMRDDIRSAIEHAPENTVLLVTIDAREKQYGRPSERPDRLRQLFENVAPDHLSKSDCRGHPMQDILARLTTDFMTSAAQHVARPGRFIPAFQLVYKDKAEMITVGGILPHPTKVASAEAIIRDARWRCSPSRQISAPLLTVREALALQAMLPTHQPLTRAAIQNAGLDLDEDQIAVFEMYYREYPAYAQIVT